MKTLYILLLLTLWPVNFSWGQEYDTTRAECGSCGINGYNGWMWPGMAGDVRFNIKDCEPLPIDCRWECIDNQLYRICRRERAHETARDIDENLTAEEMDSMIRPQSTLYEPSVITGELDLRPDWQQHPDRWYEDTIRLCDTVKYYTWITEDSSLPTMKHYCMAFDSLIYRDSIVHKPKIPVYLTEKELQKLMDWLHPKVDSLTIMSEEEWEKYTKGYTWPMDDTIRGGH